MKIITGVLFTLISISSLIHGIWYIKKFRNLWNEKNTQLNVGRTFIGSIVGIIIGILFLNSNFAPQKHPTDWVGVCTLSIGVAGLFAYSIYLIRQSKFGEINDFLGKSYVFLSILLLVLDFLLFFI